MITYKPPLRGPVFPSLGYSRTGVLAAPRAEIARAPNVCDPTAAPPPPGNHRERSDAKLSHPSPSPDFGFEIALRVPKSLTPLLSAFSARRPSINI